MRILQPSINLPNVPIKLGPILEALGTIHTPDYGTVVLDPTLHARWNADAKAIVGWPIADSFKFGANGVAVYCESGMIVSTPANGVHIVYGRIYLKYRDLNDVFGPAGVPVADEEAAPNGGRMSRFTGHTIYWSGATGAHTVYGAIRDHYLALGGPGGFLGYPTSDEEGVSNGHAEVGRTNRFQGGVILWSGATGAWEVHGGIRDAWENEHRGATGTFGFPLSNETRSAGDKYRFNDFQSGVIVWRASDGAIFPIQKMDVYLESFNSKGDDGIGGAQDVYVFIDVSASSGERYATRMPSSGDFGQSKQVSQALITVNRMQSSTTFHVRMDGWDSDSGRPFDNDDHLGLVEHTYSMDDLWGMDENASHWVSDFEARYKLRPILAFDRSKFRENCFWKFDNFTTGALSWRQFAETFRDVANDEGSVHFFDHLFYETVYKSVAGTGNCFGMCWESIFAQVGRSIYREPIGLVAPANGHEPSLPANAEVMDTINIRHGYQVGGEMLDFFLGKFVTGQTHDPRRAFIESRAQFAAGDYPALAITKESLAFGGHVLRPYAWDDSHKPWRIYVCDPNKPLTSGPDPHDVFVSIDPDANTFSYPFGTNDVWQGGTWSGGRLYSIPFHTVCSMPRTPFWEAFALLVAGSIIILGGDASTEQIQDAQGRKFYKDGVVGGTQRWEDIQPDNARIPNMARVPLLRVAPLLLKLLPKRAPELYFATGSRPKPGDASPSPALRNFATTFQANGGLDVRIAQGSGAYSWGLRTAVASHVTTVPAGAAGKDGYLVENMGRLMQAVTYLPANEKTVAIAVAGSVPSTSRPHAFGIDNLMLRAGQQVRTHFDPDTGALVVENPGGETKLDLHVTAGGKVAPGPVRSAIPLGANSVTRFEPVSWVPADVPTTKIKMSVGATLQAAQANAQEI